MNREATITLQRTENRGNPYIQPILHNAITEALVLRTMLLRCRFLLFSFGLFAFFWLGGCTSFQQEPANAYGKSSFRQDSLQVETLLRKGDSIYARRDGLATIAESMVYFDSAHRVAQRLADTLLLANTLYFIGNVYNAWNKEPQTTIDYYQRSSDLYNRLPQKTVKAFYVRQMIAHAYDGEKAADTTRCVQYLLSALHDLKTLPDSLRQKMFFLSDFAWVASNAGAFSLADSFLQTVAPRHRIFNDPQSNNYLDHYYLTRARMDVLGQGRRQSLFLDSLRLALAHCGNRFDSAYYSNNLSTLLEVAGQPNDALYYARLSEELNQQVGQNDVLSVLRQELLDRQVQAGKERESRIQSELKQHNMLLIGMAMVGLLLALLGVLWQRRKKESIERKRQQDFTRLLLQKEEDERRRIATDLHDGVNHELLALKNNLLLQKPVGPEDVEGVITSVREVSRNLYPALFESVGLTASVEALCERFTKAGFFTTCDLEYTSSLTREEELQVYRIIQEALNNVAKHANAEAARITMKDTGGNFYLEVKDNGKGFDTVAVLKERSSFGLQSIQQRAATISATLSVNSSSSGTVIQLTKAIRN